MSVTVGTHRVTRVFDVGSDEPRIACAWLRILFPVENQRVR